MILTDGHGKRQGKLCRAPGGRHTALVPAGRIALTVLAFGTVGPRKLGLFVNFVRLQRRPQVRIAE